jgi:hypothetical protein
VIYRCLFVFMAAAWLAAPSLAQTGLLNDSGQTSCYNATSVGTCDSATVGDGGTFPRQDGRYGRDPAGNAGQITKTGAGAAGFDFTKVCWNGLPEGNASCTGTLVANTSGTASGSPTTDWACTKDNVTGLMWSLQTQSADWNTATGASYPDTGHNTPSRCGYSSGWRMPTSQEVISLIHYGAAAAPRIDSDYFPSTTSGFYWASEAVLPGLTAGWSFSFDTGLASSGNAKTTSLSVRLVHSVP